MRVILELAGGTLAEGADRRRRAGRPDAIRSAQFAQLRRVLGIHVEPAEARRILDRLGTKEVKHDAQSVTVIPPSWRRDLSREIDLVEEVARIHGYDKIPEDVSVPMGAESSHADRPGALEGAASR